MILQRPGTSVCYEVSGDGPAVVLIHAISTGRRIWDHHVAQLRARSRVITFDARGVGDSGDLTGTDRVRDQIADRCASPATSP